MKKCSACGTQYTDDTLKFCLQDGTPLRTTFDGDTPTAVLGETETELALGRLREAGRETVALDKAALPRSNTPIAVILTVVGMLFLFAVFGIVAWLYSSKDKAEVALNTANQPTQNKPDTLANSTPIPSRSARPSPSRPISTPSTVNAPDTTPPPDESGIRSEISRTISDWELLTESKDMGSLRALYSDRLDYYYAKRNVNLGSVIEDKQRASRDFTSLNIDIAVTSVTPDASGESATALYTKDWSFSGDRKPFCGTIKSQMLFRKINGAWLIAGEKDIAKTFRRTC